MSSPDHPPPASDDLISTAVEILESGGLVAYPTDTFYGLGADGLSESAVQNLYRAKGRAAADPVPLLVEGLEALEPITGRAHDFVVALAEAFWPGALTMILPATDSVPDAVTAGTGAVGVRAPDHPVPMALLRGLGRPVTGTSANRSGQPPSNLFSEVAANLAGEVDLVIPGSCGNAEMPSTVIDCTTSPPRITRAGAISADRIIAVIQDSFRGRKS